MNPTGEVYFPVGSLFSRCYEVKTSTNGSLRHKLAKGTADLTITSEAPGEKLEVILHIRTVIPSKIPTANLGFLAAQKTLSVVSRVLVNQPFGGGVTVENINGLSVAVCTRNRPEDLKRCLTSLKNQRLLPPGFTVEILIIDDGDLPDRFVAELEGFFPLGMSARYCKKQKPGLFLSRIKAVAEASHEIILFLDDDVELQEDYLAVLVDTYSAFDRIAGVGGIDLLFNPGPVWRLYARFICHNSGDPARLSKSGYGGSQVYRAEAAHPFETEFLSGCNMSFKKQALEDLKPVDWLNGYSMGEDIYLSYTAGQKGPLLINPKLKVKHYSSPTARDCLQTVAFTEIVNHLYLLNYTKAKWWQYLCFFWTAIGLFLVSLPYGASRPKARGYVRAILFLAGRALKKLYLPFNSRKAK